MRVATARVAWVSRYEGQKVKNQRVCKTVRKKTRVKPTVGNREGADEASSCSERGESNELSGSQKPAKPRKKKSVQQIVEEAVYAIIEKIVAEAMDGSYQHLKVLFEMFPEAFLCGDSEEKRTLAELLLKELNDEGEVGVLA